MRPGRPGIAETFLDGWHRRFNALAMVFKLIESAQARWRALNAPHLVALVRAGARFERGLLVERSEPRSA